MTHNIEILLVEDDHINMLVAKMLLKDSFSVETAISGQEALELAESKNFDAFLLDINLGFGKMSGVEVLQALRAMPNYKNTPIYAVTSYASDEDKESLLKQGFNRHFAKPIDKDEIITWVKADCVKG